MTSGIAGAAAAGIPVTHRGLARSVAFVTGETDAASDPAPVDWASLAAIDTIVVYMAGRTARSVADRLLAAGRAATTPVAIIVDATLPTQAVRWLNLERLARLGAGPFEGRPALLVVGDVVGLGVTAASLEAAG